MPKIETNFLNAFDNLIIFRYFTFDTFKLVHYNKITISASIYFTKIATCAVGRSKEHPTRLPHSQNPRLRAFASACASAFCSFGSGLLIQCLACIAINGMQTGHWIATAQVEKFTILKNCRSIYFPMPQQFILHFKDFLFFILYLVYPAMKSSLLLFPLSQRE